LLPDLVLGLLCSCKC